MKGLGVADRHLRLAGAALDRAQVVRVTRPGGGFLLDELADTLEADFQA